MTSCGLGAWPAARSRGQGPWAAPCRAPRPPRGVWLIPHGFQLAGCVLPCSSAPYKPGACPPPRCPTPPVTTACPQTPRPPPEPTPTTPPRPPLAPPALLPPPAPLPTHPRPPMLLVWPRALRLRHAARVTPRPVAVPLGRPDRALPGCGSCGAHVRRGQPAGAGGRAAGRAGRLTRVRAWCLLSFLSGGPFLDPGCRVQRVLSCCLCCCFLGVTPEPSKGRRLLSCPPPAAVPCALR